MAVVMKNVKPEYIVYCSHAGHTKAYAEMFAEATGLPIMTNIEARKELEDGSKIIYFGWVQQNIVQGYSEAREHFDICAVVSVGMFGRGTGVLALRNVSGIDMRIPLFPLKGGIEVNKLGPANRALFTAMKPGIVKHLKDKANPTPLEMDMLNTITKGGNYVKPRYLRLVLDWYNDDIYEEQHFEDDFSNESLEAIMEEFEAKAKKNRPKKEHKGVFGKVTKFFAAPDEEEFEYLARKGRIERGEEDPDDNNDNE